MNAFAVYGESRVNDTASDEPPTKVRVKSCDTPPSSPKSMNAAEVRGPEPDAIKMFVGQVPRHMDENDLKKMFEDFGPVYQINVLRDKQTGQSKGCCFVTFYTRKSALDAQNAMHNIRTLPGMHHPIQMKPADSENRNERKLFIGMISKKCSENDVRLMFSGFGSIEECTVLRDANGQSRGCAFVTFASRQCAISAIKSMHQAQTMDGCSAPLVVKFADTPKEKDQRKMQTQLQQMTQNIWNMASLSNLNSMGPQYLALLQAMAAAGNGGGGGVNYTQLASNVNHLQLQQILAASLPNQTSGLTNLSSLQSGLSNSPTSANSDLAASNLQGLAALASMSTHGVGLNPMSVQNLAALAAMGSGGSSGMSPSGTLSSSSSPGSTIGALNGIGGSSSSLTGNGNGLEGFPSSFPTIPQAYAATFSNTLRGLTGSATVSKQQEGPDGANLFIYHLPQEFSDSDLAQTFMPFGNVLSAKVFIDKQTNLSKCFGFISYDNPVSAQSAIQAMNGFQIGTKRLKVQLKRSKETGKPY